MLDILLKSNYFMKIFFDVYIFDDFDFLFLQIEWNYAAGGAQL